MTNDGINNHGTMEYFKFIVKNTMSMAGGSSFTLNKCKINLTRNEEENWWYWNLKPFCITKTGNNLLELIDTKIYGFSYVHCGRRAKPNKWNQNLAINVTPFVTTILSGIA